MSAPHPRVSVADATPEMSVQHVIVHAPPPGYLRLTPVEAWLLAETIARAAARASEAHWPATAAPLAVCLDEHEDATADSLVVA